MRWWVLLFVFLGLAPSVLGDIGKITRLHPAAVYVDQNSNAYIVFGRDNQLRFRVWDNTSAAWIGDAFNYEEKGEPIHYPSFPTGVVPYLDHETADLFVLLHRGNTYYEDYYKWVENGSGILGNVPTTDYHNQPLFGGGGVRWCSLAVGLHSSTMDQFALLYDSRLSHKDLIAVYRDYNDPTGKWYNQMVTGRIESPITLNDIGYQPFAYYCRNEEGEDEIWVSCVAPQSGGTDKLLLIKWDPSQKQPLESFLGVKYQKGLKGQEPVGYVYRIVDTKYKGFENCWHSCVKVTSDYWIYWVYTNAKRQLVVETFVPSAIRTPTDVTKIQWYNTELSQGWNTWDQTIFETSGGVRNIALDIDDITNQAHIAYTVEDATGHVDVYYLYGQTSAGGVMSWNRTLLSDDWCVPKTDYGVAIGLDVKNHIAYIPRSRFDSANPSNSYMEYAAGPGAMAVAFYSDFIANGTISVISTTVFRGELFNATVRLAAPGGCFRLYVFKLDPVTGQYSDKAENIIKLYWGGETSILTGGDIVEMMLWHAGTYSLSVYHRLGAGAGWEPIPNVNLTMTSLEDNKDVYVVTDWGYRSDEPCNYSTYWNNITSSDWEVIFGLCYPEGRVSVWEDGVPPSAFDPGMEIVFRDATVMPLNASSPGNWSNQILPPLENFYAHRDQKWVAVIRLNQTKYPESDWLRKIFAYMYFDVYYDGMSGNLSVPSTCVEQTLVTLTARIRGLAAAGDAYEQTYVVVDMECLDDPSIRSDSYKIPIYGGNGSVVGSFSPAGNWRLVMYAKPTDPKESNFMLDSRDVSVTTGSFLGDAFLNQRRILGMGVFNALVAGAILLSMCLVVGVYTQSFTAMGIMLLLGGIGFTYTGWLPGWAGGIILALSGLMLARLVRAVIGI